MRIQWIVCSILVSAITASIREGSVDGVEGGSVVTTSDTTTCPIDRTPQIDDFYCSFISSDMYIESIRDKKIPDENFAIISKNFGKLSTIDPSSSDLVERALRGELVTTTTSPSEEGELVVSSSSADNGYVGETAHVLSRSPVVDDGIKTRLDDYIATNAHHLLSRVARVEELLNTPTPEGSTNFSDWFSTAARAANLELYYLHIDMSMQSSCINLESRMIRKLIEQIHYRLVSGGEGRGFTSREEVLQQFMPTLRLIHARLEELHKESDMYFSRFAGAPRARMLAPGVTAVVLEVGVEVGCWCIQQCIRYYRNRLTTTTTTTTSTQSPSTVAAWIVEGRRRQVDRFLSSANSNLDEIMVSIGMVSASTDGDLEERLSGVRTDSMVKIVAITKGILAFVGSTFDPTETLNTSFQLSDFLNQKHTVIDWPQVKKQIMVTVVKLRNILSTIVIDIPA